MEWPIILLGMLIGLILAMSQAPKQKRSPPPTPATADVGFAPAIQTYAPNLNGLQRGDTGQRYDFMRHWSDARYGSPYTSGSIRRDLLPRGPPQSFLQRQTGSERVNTRTDLESWRKSIVGLLKLAESNLDSAKRRLEMKDFKGTVEAATTSVENVSRALLHCYGEKPDVGSGQEEALRLLSRRFQGNGKVRFERAIEDVACLYRDRIGPKHLSEHNIELRLIKEPETKQILGCAFRIVKHFRQMVSDNFTTEIPELGEACPKCHAVSTSVWGFVGNTANYQCNECRHKWIQPRAL